MTRYKNVVIRASAGTGKTYQLSNRYLALINSGAPPEQILATTFTRKAAAEILERVIVRLARAVDDAKERNALSSALDDDLLTSHRCLDLLERLLKNLHRLRVCTLDSFFSQLAGSFSLELGLPPGWRITEEVVDDKLRSQAIELVLQGGGESEVSRLMHLLTKGESERSVAELVRSRVNQLYSLYLQTEESAWKQFPKLTRLKKEELQSAVVALSAADIPEDKRFEEALKSDLNSAKLGDWERFIDRGLAGKVLIGSEKYGGKDIPSSTVAVYQRLLGHARAVLIEQLSDQTGATFDLLRQFDQAYQMLKRDSRAFRFEDITHQLSIALTDDSVDRQEFRMDAPIAHLLLDEFQDTSLAQWNVIRRFAERITNDEIQKSFFWLGGQKSLFCVGDVKQAIYGWRGGQAEIFDALERHLNGLTREALNQSYRSSQVVIDTVNRVFSRLDQHDNLDKLESAVHKWSERFAEHTTARKELPGYCELMTAEPSSEDEDAENGTLRTATRKILQLIADSPGCEIGVLTRRNRLVAKLIYMLRKAGVEASEEGGNPLTDSVAVQVIMSLFQLADHPGDTIARFHVLHSPLAPELNLNLDDIEASTHQLANRLRTQLVELGYGQTVHVWVKRLTEFCNERDRARLDQLVDAAYRYEAIATMRPSDFVQFVRKERVSDPTSASVRVMTIHQAKGLQFDIVVLADLDALLIGQNDACVTDQADPTEPIDKVCLYRNVNIQALLPQSMQEMFEKSHNKLVAEALCVLYVAMTRAVHALHMIVSSKSKTLQKTPAGILRAALAESESFEPEEVLFEHGDRNWYSSIEARPERLVTTEHAVAPEPISFLPPTTSIDTGLERVSPSSLEGGRFIDATSLLRIDNNIALARGTLIHAWFEQIEWLDLARPSSGQLKHVAQQLETYELSIDEQLEQFDAMLDDQQIAATLSRDFYFQPEDAEVSRLLGMVSSLQLEVHNERRFAVRDEDRILSGTIDRLVLCYDGQQLVGADIIDFKTDKIDIDDPASIKSAVEHYRPQLNAYRRAVAKMFRLRDSQILCRLLFVGAGIMADAE